MAPSSKGWVTARLRDCLINYPQYGANASAIDYDPQLPRYIRITDITDYGTLSDDDLKSISEKDAIGYILEPGDFLFARTGATVGKAYLHRASSDRMAYAGYLIRFRIDESKLIPEFLEQYTKTANYWAWVRKTIHVGAQPNINADEYGSMEIPLPTLNQQRKIIETISIWDLAIENTERLIEAKKILKSGLIQCLIDNNPNIAHWQTYQLGQFLKERNERSISHDEYKVITSSRRGIFLQDEYFTRQIASSNNKGYKIIRKGDFTFRSMSDDGLFVFNQVKSIDTGIISPAYAVFHPDGIDSDFLYYFLNSHSFSRELAKAPQGGTRKALRFKAIKELEVKLPLISEQKKIGETISFSSKEIELEQRRLEFVKTQKRGLMQKLLTGEWRVKSVREEG